MLVRGKFWALAGVLLMAVCAAAAWGAVKPDPALKRWPKWPFRVGCTDIGANPAKAFARTTPAERGSGPAEAALQGYLSTPAAAEVPKSGWRLFVQTNDRAEFLHGRLESEEGPLWLGFEKSGGPWQASGPYHCKPRTLRDGNRATEWTLYPDLPPPKPTDANVVVAIHEQACTGGRDPIHHLDGRHVRYGKRAVVVMLWLEPLEGPHTCPGNPVGRLTLDLPGPLGDRQLYDGATYPPRRVEYGEDPLRIRP